jgi:phasin family protein
MLHCSKNYVLESSVVDNPFLNLEAGKFLTDLMPKMPALDGVLASQERNIEALKQANQLAIEGLQTIARRQAEIVRGGMEEASALIRDMTKSKSPEDHVTYQTEAAKKVLSQSISNARELTEIISRATNEALDVLNKRLGESLDEMRATVTKK